MLDAVTSFHEFGLFWYVCGFDSESKEKQKRTITISRLLACVAYE